MNLARRILKFIKSFNYFECELNQPTVLMGYQGEDLLHYFDINKDNFICSTTKRPISFKIFLVAIILFFKTALLRPVLFFKTLRWFHTIYFICAYLKLKKTTCLISFTDYNPLPIYIKKTLDKKIKTIGIQNSRRENRLKHSNFDYYYLLTPLRAEEKINFDECKTYEFGSLRLLLSINENELWEEINNPPDHNVAPVDFILISSLTHDFLNFIDVNLDEKFDPVNLKFKISKLFEKYNENKKNFRELRFLNFLILCEYITDYVKSKKDNIIVLSRTEPDSLDHFREKKFYNKFSNIQFKCLHKIDKYNFITSKKNGIFVSDISTLSRECLSINMKCVFFNYYIKYTGDYWTVNNAIFYSNKEKKKDFYFRLDNIKLINKVNFMFEKNKIKKESCIIPSSRKKLEDFLKISNLKLRYNNVKI